MPVQFWNGAEYLAWKKRRRWNPLWHGLAAVMFSAAAFVWLPAIRNAISPPVQKRGQFTWPTATITSSSTCLCAPAPYNDLPPAKITSGPAYDSLTAALGLWKKAGFELARPTLFHGTCRGIEGEAIACADLKTGEIEVTSLFGVFKENMGPTIMMHEVGHLLGVPHIDGDPLMDPSSQEPVASPTPAAIALARLARKNR